MPRYSVLLLLLSVGLVSCRAAHEPSPHEASPVAPVAPTVALPGVSIGDYDCVRVTAFSFRSKYAILVTTEKFEWLAANHGPAFVVMACPYRWTGKRLSEFVDGPWTTRPAASYHFNTRARVEVLSGGAVQATFHVDAWGGVLLPHEPEVIYKRRDGLEWLAEIVALPRLLVADDAPWDPTAGDTP